MLGLATRREVPDDVLLQRAAAGDESAFLSLYRRKQSAVYRFALGMCGNPDVADDVTQEVFIAVARAPERFDAARGSVASWLYGMARNHVLKRLEKDGATESLDDDGPEPAAAADSVADVLARQQTVEAVRRAVLALPGGYREAIVLCDLKEVPYAEAAMALGCPVGTVRSRVSRGRALLAEKLQGMKKVFV